MWRLLESSNLIIGQYTLAGNHPEIPAYRLDNDHYFVGALRLSPQSEEITTIATIATGGGSYNPLLRKPVAQIAVASIFEAFQSTSTNEIVLAFKEGFDLASRRIAPLESSATCAALAIKGHKLYLGNVGDCRIFLIRHGQVQQVSITHTLAEALIEGGHATVEDLENPTSIYDGWTPTRMLGYEELCKPDFRLRLRDDESDEQALAHQGLELKSNDGIVVCSGGVFWHWKSPHRWQLFEEYFLKPIDDSQKTVEQFVHAVRDQGGFHALTVVMLQIP